jgi:hypothetical protein
LHHDAYWIVGDVNFDDTVFEHNATDGSLLTTVAPDQSEYWQKLVIAADRKFLIVVSGGGRSPLRTIDTTTKLKVDTGEHKASDATLCDDGTIVSARYTGGKLATYNINGAGQLTSLAAVDADDIAIVACSPGSGFVVAANYFSAQVRSFAISAALTQTVVDTLIPPTNSRLASLAFNPATSDLYLLQIYGDLSVYAFDSNTGMFGALQASVTTGGSYGGGVPETMQFAYGKIVVRAKDQLLAYDAALNLLSNETIISGLKTAICISEGLLCC